MKKTQNTKAQIAAFLTALFWGYSFTWTTQILEFFDPMSIIFMRLVIALSLMIPLMIALRMQEKVRLKDLGALALLGFFQPFLYFIFETYGVKLTTSTLSSVIISTIPLLVPVGAFLAFKEQLTVLNIAGIIISFSGVTLIVLERRLDFQGGYWGVVILFMAVITAIIYMILLRKLAGKHNVFTINIYQNIFGMIYFLPFFLKNGVPTLMEIDFSFSWVFPLVALAVFGSAAAFLLFTYAIGKIGATRAAAYNNLVPVVTAIAAYFKFAEDISFQKTAGIAIVIAGLFLVQRQKQLNN
ncbi:putative DMT superfamily transporter inner membrane protein [Salinivirga cyanobacteriivorans]|uniref:Putative DMT superfamily transporter inner membrane protein n=1 Tax=Salinivirga cyanobacteriivorans TaxID=1307839 RepID=A0A0S2HVV1_9BACT|nr:DMT family transporter [Salinivirga cyanobacteriivorans]ALO14187.1 putative DMT superfamily transporter inner membrane protein [Salinivirga cyanobacteriivorans]